MEVERNRGKRGKSMISVRHACQVVLKTERDIPCSGGTWQIVPSTGDHKWKWSGINNDFSHNIKKNLNIQNITLKKT